jgi:hypothetical protein
MSMATPLSLDGSGEQRTVKGTVDVKDGTAIAWEATTVLEDKNTNAWRCDSLTINGVIIR